MFDLLRTRWHWATKCPGYFTVRLLSSPGSEREVRYHIKRRIASLANLLGVSHQEVEAYLNEADSSGRVRLSETMVATLPYAGHFRGGPELYTIVRALKPMTVVETGVGIGLSSHYVLEALERNNHGRLTSIDLPNADPNWTLPAHSAPGQLVPQALRGRWELIIGDARSALPDVLSRLNKLDVFFHDSEHTYSNMTMECEIALKYLEPSGLLISDDSMWNTAILDIRRKHRLVMSQVYHRGRGAPFTVLRR